MDECDNSYEPMDIDLSSHSVSAMDISYVEPQNEDAERDVIPDILNIKPLNANDLIMLQAHKSCRKQTCTKHLLKCLVYVLVSLISIVIYQVGQFTCSENLNTTLLKSTLTAKVYGQTSATDMLIKALESEVDKKIIILYGGTGVGKTYTSSIILENLLKYNNIYHYTMPGFTQTSTDFMIGLIFCKSSLIIVDDLKRNDISQIENIIKDLIHKSEINSKNVTIMLLYNIEILDDKFDRKYDKTFQFELQKSLGSTNAQKYFIKFKTLTDDHLRKCIENEFPSKKFSKAEMTVIMKNFNVTMDGCKGVYQKMKYLSIV